MELTQKLDRYCAARAMGRREEQLEIANKLVDEDIPFLVERLGQVMIERNKAQENLCSLHE